MLAAEHGQIGVVHHRIRYGEGVGQFRCQSDIFYDFDGVFVVAAITYEVPPGTLDVSQLVLPVYFYGF